MSDVVFGVREFQAHLGDALRAVKRGDRVIVTSRGTPVAALVPADARPPSGSREERILRRLAAAGRVRLGAAGRIGPFRSPAIAGLTEQVLGDRR